MIYHYMKFFVSRLGNYKTKKKKNMYNTQHFVPHLLRTMRILLLPFLLPFFSTFFIKNVVGLEFLNDISCTEMNPQSNEILYTYDWVIRNFQDYYNQFLSNLITSDRFYSPVPIQLQPSKGKYFEWRLTLNPNEGYFGGYVSVGLAAIETDYEKKNIIDLQERTAVHSFELLVNHNNVGIKRRSIAKGPKIETFSSTKYGVSSTVYKFVDVGKIFFNETIKTTKTDLIVRVIFYKVENNFVKPQSIPPPDFMEYDQYFNDETFSDIIFKFDCGSTIRASSMFLATQSLYFKKLLKDVKDSEKIVINMNGDKFDGFYGLLYYIYTKKLRDNLTFEELMDLYNEADSREINDLKILISCRMINLLDENNMDTLFTLGLKTQNNILKNAVLKFVANK